MIADAQAAASLAREMLSEIASDHAERFERSKDRVHELKKEIATARLRFKEAVAPKHHDVFEREVRAWAKHSGQPPSPTPSPAPHVEPGRCDNCGRPNDAAATVCASCGFALPVVERKSPRARAPRRESPAQVELEQPRRADDRPDMRMIAVIAGAVFLALGLAGYVGARREKRDVDDGKPHEPSAHAPTSGLSNPVKIPSCSCISARDNPATEVILLAPPSDRTQPWSVDIRRAFGTLNRYALPEHIGAVVSASEASLASDVGMACDENVFVLIANDRATAWSSSHAAWRWNAKLPEAFSTPHVAAPALEGTSITSTCTQLDIAADHVVVPLASGKTAKISLIDGRAL